MGSLLFRLFGAGLFIALAVFALELAQQDAATADIQLVARRIEQGEPVSLTALRSVVAEQEAPASCRSYIQRALLTVHLAYLEQQDQSLDYDAWSNAAAGAEAATARAVRCMPGEGNAWIRHSMVEHAIAEQPGPLAALIAMSAKTSPADAAPLMARLTLYAQSSTQTRARAAAAIESDMAAYLAKARPYDVLRIVDPVPADLVPVVSATLATLSPQRREDLAKALPSLR